MIVSSIKDVVFSQRAPQTALKLRPGIPITMSSKVQDPLTLAPVQDDHHVNGGGGTKEANGTNGTNGSTTGVSRFDPHFTDNVINATGPKASPRLRKVMASLTRHLHDFCRENEITIDEYMAGIDLVSRLSLCCTTHVVI